jgi:metal-responsive CopG/Arc/MetJ family transcriptional regulator
MKRPKNRGENKVDYGTISLPSPLIKKVKERIKGTGMNSVSAYVAFVLRQILSSGSSGELISKQEEAEVKKRLKQLGYDD